MGQKQKKRKILGICSFIAGMSIIIAIALSVYFSWYEKIWDLQNQEMLSSVAFGTFYFFLFTLAVFLIAAGIRFRQLYMFNLPYHVIEEKIKKKRERAEQSDREENIK